MVFYTQLSPRKSIEKMLTNKNNDNNIKMCELHSSFAPDSSLFLADFFLFSCLYTHACEACMCLFIILLSISVYVFFVK